LDGWNLATQCLRSVLDRAQTIEFELDALMVLLVDVGAQARLQICDVSEFVEVEELGLERAEEALHGGVVQAIAFGCLPQPDFG
jgi:hypothetical protein